MIEHKSIVNLVYGQRKFLNISPSSRVLQYANYVFDASVWEIFNTLSFGASCYIISERERKNVMLLSKFINDHKINIGLLPPSLLNIIEHKDLLTFTTVVAGGESSTKKLIKSWDYSKSLINAYGPTEITVCSNTYNYNQNSLNSNIGRPINNTKCYILDTNLQPVIEGMTGQLCVAGVGLSRGYLNQPELTKQRFIDNPFATDEDFEKGYTRLYKTGDLARWLPDRT
ncbi:AMP-binding protein, partial [Facilibium subflavum]|uniref:AMP-binding protein n=1 Tax=Facilibium subflavum TaxID=2219058 RepID=UPI001F2AACC0